MKKLFLLLLILGAVDITLACSCAPATLEEHITYADTVFLGKILSTNVDALERGVTVRVQPMTAWKGTPQEIIYTTADPSSCGYYFEEGKEYIIFAYEDNGKYSTDICSATAPPNDETLTALGEGKKTNGAIDDVGTQSFFGQQDMAVNLFWIFVFIAIAVIGIIWHLRAKRKIERSRK